MPRIVLKLLKMANKTYSKQIFFNIKKVVKNAEFYADLKSGLKSWKMFTQKRL